MLKIVCVMIVKYIAYMCSHDMLAKSEFILKCDVR